MPEYKSQVNDKPQQIREDTMDTRKKKQVLVEDVVYLNDGCTLYDESTALPTFILIGADRHVNLPNIPRCEKMYAYPWVNRNGDVITRSRI